MLGGSGIARRAQQLLRSMVVEETREDDARNIDHDGGEAIEPMEAGEDEEKGQCPEAGNHLSHIPLGAITHDNQNSTVRRTDAHKPG